MKNKLSDLEFNKIVYDWNQTETPYPKEKTIHQLFEENVEKTPDNIAVVFKEEKLTYRELNDKVNQLAHMIRKEYRGHWNKDVKGDTLIGIYIERSLEMIISILGILKAGGAYVPFDSADPEERLKFKINDCGCKMVLTSSKNIFALLHLAGSDTLPVAVDSYWDEISKFPKSNPIHINKSTDLAYVIYTSGSTGQPKGVMIEHISISRLVKFPNYINIKKNDIFLHAASPAFDATTFEIWGALLNSCKLILLPSSEVFKNSVSFKKYIEQNGITILWLTSVLFNQLAMEKNTVFKTLKYLLVGGEALNKDIITKLVELPVYLRPKYILNGYGPTETTTFATICNIGLNEIGYPSIPIGRLINGTICYILDIKRNIVPVGKQGELYIGGDGLARGYLNRPELTAERFISNLFASDEDKAAKKNLRLYKTGDLVKWLPNGSLEFVGRNDNQVKIRGYRIELEEIELKLSEHSHIKQCIVRCKKNINRKYLVAYYTADKELLFDTLYNYLLNKLPDYMIPSFFVYVDKFILNTSGKIEKTALPEFTFKRDIKNYIMPTNELETKLCEIWKDILGIKKIGINDDFFRLGGDSILGMSIANRISEMGYLFRVAELLEKRTISAISSGLLKEDFCPEKKYKNKTKNLSEIQRLILNHQLSTGLDVIYNEHFTLDLFLADNKIKNFKNALKKIIRTHEVFRYYLKSYDKIEVFLQDDNIQLDIIDLTKFKSQSINSEFKRELKKALNVKIDLFTYPLYKFILFKVDKNKYKFVFIFHHLLADAESIYSIFIPQLIKLIENPDHTISKSLTYSQYVAYRENNNIQSTDVYIDEDIDSKRIDIFNKKEINSISKGGHEIFKFSKKETQEIESYARSIGHSVFSVMLSSFFILLNKYSNKKNISVQSIKSDRPAGFDSTFGCFLKNIIIDCKISPDITVEELINQIAENTIFSLNQTMPFEKTLSAYRKKGFTDDDMSNVAFVFEPKLSDNVNLNLTQSDCLPDFIKYDLQFEFDKRDTLFARIEYKVELFTEDQIKKLWQSLKKIIFSVVHNPFIKIKDISPILKEDYHKMVYQWNKADYFNDDKTIIEIFQEKVGQFPEHTALIFENKKLTYAELNERSNRLAHAIRNKYKKRWKKEVKKDTLIGLYADRSIEMIVGILGILKSGAAYVPFDTGDPERLKFKINDCKCKMVITSSKNINDLLFLSDSYTIPLSIDDLWNEIENFPYCNLELINESSDLAYVIYTSGSTGKPKGVLQTHANVNRLFKSCDKYFEFNENDTWTLFHSVSFDFSVWEIWGALLYGGTLVIPDYNQTKDTSLFYELCKTHKVSVLSQTPAAFYQFIEVDLSHKKIDVKLDSLRYVVFGGDTLNIAQLKGWMHKYGCENPQLINMYGITETTVHVSYKKLTEEDAKKSISNIGKTLPDLTSYILNGNLSPVPIGVIGELYIGGCGHARGYLHRESLTKERFIPNPFSSEEDKSKNHNLQLYKTGDLARWLPSGDIEYIGRNDNQIQLRGFRIELGEIETILSSHPQVKQTAVLVKEKENSKHLVAYYVSDTGAEIDQDKLTTYMSNNLPNYMTPNFFVHMDAFPLTNNGKLDRKALPSPKMIDEESYIAPKNDLEIKLCAIWIDLLGLEKIGINDDFFRIGGDSILSIQLTSRLRNNSIICSVKDIFECRTIERLVQVIKDRGDDKKVEIKAEQGLLEGEFNLLPIQKWFFESDFPKYNHWNQSFLVKVPKLDIKKLGDTIKSLVLHHDILRTTYSNSTAGILQQKYNSEIIIPEIKVLDVSKNIENLGVVLTDWQTRFNIKTGPLWQIGYLHGYEDGSSRLFFALHHLIVDAVSWRILVEDIKLLYEGKSLSRKTSSYRQWTKAVHEYAESHPDEKKVWDKMSVKKTDYEKYLCSKNNVRYITLDKDITYSLLKKANGAYNSEVNDLLLTALAYALAKIYEVSKNYITLEGHGRESINDSVDVSRTIGWFTTMYPVELELKEELALTIKSIKENLRAIPSKGLGYGALRCLEEHNLHVLLPPVSFNYLGQFDLQQEGFWQIVDESSGSAMHPENPNHNIIDINGMAINGQFKFSFESKIDEIILDKLANEFKRQLELITNHCIYKLETGTQESTASDYVYEPIIIVNEKIEGPPLIFIHPGEGGSESYLNTLMVLISKKIKLVLIDNYLLKTNNDKNINDFKDIASYYIELLMDADLLKQGCFIGGFCFGAITSYEMMMQLEKMGINVYHGFMLDPLYTNLIGIKDEDLPTDDIKKWYTPYHPENSTQDITLFKCMIPIEGKKLFEMSAQTPYLGFDKISSTFTEHKMYCSHYKLLDMENMIFISKIINETIENTKKKGLAKNHNPVKLY